MESKASALDDNSLDDKRNPTRHEIQSFRFGR